MCVSPPGGKGSVGVLIHLLDKRSARLSRFVIQRGLVISLIQAVFSAIFYFAAIAIYNVCTSSVVV